MTKKFWNDTNEDCDRSRRRQAEFLVRDQVAFSAVQMIVAMDDDVAQAAKEAVAEMPDRPTVVVWPDWYY